MIKRYFDDYENFRCIADKCPSTCCSGWLIEIDNESLKRYETISKNDADFGRRIDFSEECFFQKENGDCAFLREDGLCKMQKEHGEEMLCRTCDSYPRHIEEFPGVREYSLSASCPVASDKLVKMQGYLDYKKEEDEKVDTYSEDEYDDFNFDLYERLLEIREIIIDVLKDEGLNFETKAKVIDSCIKKIQSDLDEGEYINPLEYFSKKEDAKTEFADYYNDLLLMQKLEPLRMDFVGFVNDTIEEYEKEIKEDSAKLSCEFEEFKSHNIGLDLIQTNIAIYFIFTYFCGAVYDDYVYSAARLAIFSARVVTIMAFENWRKSKDAKFSETLYEFCRELENSNDNLLTIRDELDNTYYQQY